MFVKVKVKVNCSYASRESTLDNGGVAPHIFSVGMQVVGLTNTTLLQHILKRAMVDPEQICTFWRKVSCLCQKSTSP